MKMKLIQSLKLAWRYKYLPFTILLQLLARIMPIGTITLHRLRGVKIGKGCNISKEAFIDEMEPRSVSIGNEVVISPHVKIIAHSNYGKALYPYMGKRKVEKVRIEDGAFIGIGAIILKGVTIGKCAVVGAGSVVTKDVAPYTVAAGVPAKPIKRLKKKYKKGDISLYELFYGAEE
ncbi:acyltransferase [Candidatus Woesearchaeota archaeon]|nr:acyltransferase [Candidatus Woesearchaeota archaeon]